MIERALIHVAGPAGAGKTTLIESLLRAYDGCVLVARCMRNDSLRRSKETSPRKHPELQRYRTAGAVGVATFSFPTDDIDSDAFFATNLMLDFSEAVVLEGDRPFSYLDLQVYVAPAIPHRGRLLVRRKRDRAAEAHAKADAIEQVMRQPDGVERLLAELLGEPVAQLARRNPTFLEEARARFLAELEQVRSAPPPKPTAHWAIREGYEGIEHAQVVVVNVRDDRDVAGGERLLADLRRVRKDNEVFDDILGWRGTKVPITAVAANLADGADPGTKKVMARIKRTIRTRSMSVQ